MIEQLKPMSVGIPILTTLAGVVFCNGNAGVLMHTRWTLPYGMTIPSRAFAGPRH